MGVGISGSCDVTFVFINDYKFLSIVIQMKH